MKKHSVLDIITNSSSVLYNSSYKGASVDCKAIFDKIVKAIDDQKNVDDIFVIEEYVDPDWIEVVLERLKAEELSQEEAEKAIENGYIDSRIEHTLLHVYLRNDPHKTNILQDILNLYEVYDLESGTLEYF